MSHSRFTVGGLLFLAWSLPRLCDATDANRKNPESHRDATAQQESVPSPSLTAPSHPTTRRAVESVTCTTSANVEATCQHGGKCPTGHEQWLGKFVCDCRQAFDFAPPDNGQHFEVEWVGVECEIPVMEYCGGPANLFCVNGGMCRTSADNFEQEPCLCPDEYTGRHCEYHNQDVSADCGMMACSGHGKCHHGIKPSDSQGADQHLDLDNQGNHEFSYCACDEGYAGEHCEKEYVQCGPRHHCFHGSSCLTVHQNFKCLCATADEKVDGEFCQYVATDHCNHPNSPNLDTYEEANAMRFDADAFCVNEGTCVEVSGVFFCECPEGFTGKRCDEKVLGDGETYAPTVSLTTSAVPTEEGSVTDSPTRAPSPTDFPTEFVTADASEPDEDAFMESENGLDSETDSDDEKLEGGAKFGIVAGAFGWVVIFAVLVTYFRRRKRALQQATFQEFSTDVELT